MAVTDLATTWARASLLLVCVLGLLGISFLRWGGSENAHLILSSIPLPLLGLIVLAYMLLLVPFVSVLAIMELLEQSAPAKSYFLWICSPLAVFYSSIAILKWLG